MHLWEFIGICGIVFLLLEIFIPSMFFLNFSIAGFVTAILSVYIKNPAILTTIFVVLSFISFAFLRPILVKKFNQSKETGLNSKYIGQIANAESDITDRTGTIGIYGERWDARSEDGSLIPQGSGVKIVRNESIIMYVEKVD